jgi:hypothetical protein
MTLSPVFRSPQAVRLLEQHGIWQRLAPSLALQAGAVLRIHDDLAHVIGERFRLPAGQIPRGNDGRDGDAELLMLQDYFFLIVFLALFDSLGIAPQRLPFYAALNFCIKGTITAADNLFDDQAKSLLPLRAGGGPRYGSILQLICFERLVRRVAERAIAAGLFPREAFDRVLLGLLDRMAEIGQLEGSEEGGVHEIPTPETMIDRVHRVRGGMLFGLAFVAPTRLESGQTLERARRAEPAVARLGTAFQIVDDLTDFEFDLARRSHNLLVSWIHHRGDAAARARLEKLWRGDRPEPGLVEGPFADCARAVLEIAYQEARASFQSLADLGFWFPPALAEPVVHAIVGLDGVARMEALTDRH